MNKIKRYILIFTSLVLFATTYLSSHSLKIKRWALKIGKNKSKTIRIKQKKFYLDCSNFVRAVYYGSIGLDLFKQSNQHGIYQKLKKSKIFTRSIGVASLYVLFKLKYKIVNEPKIGDIIFFDNTYDRNRNKKWDDLLTHAGIVIDIAPDKTITFIHAGTSKHIKIDFMNLKKKKTYKKDKKIINSFLQRRYYWSGKSKLTGQLFRCFGRIK